GHHRAHVVDTLGELDGLAAELDRRDRGRHLVVADRLPVPRLPVLREVAAAPALDRAAGHAHAGGVDRGPDLEHFGRLTLRGAAVGVVVVAVVARLVVVDHPITADPGRRLHAHVGRAHQLAVADLPREAGTVERARRARLARRRRP